MLQTARPVYFLTVVQILEQICEGRKGHTDKQHCNVLLIVLMHQKDH